MFFLVDLFSESAAPGTLVVFGAFGAFGAFDEFGAFGAFGTFGAFGAFRCIRYIFVFLFLESMFFDTHVSSLYFYRYRTMSMRN